MLDQIQRYYGETLQSSADLKTDACCTPDALPTHVKPMLANVHEEVSSRYYGCGLVAPSALEGLRILDLGSGSGRDCYVLAQMVGDRGKVVGIDMTDEQLDVARRHIGWHTERFGYQSPNVEFLHGYIEKLDELELEKESFDLIVSNCVINLSPDKLAVLRGAYDLLKPGGEMYFSDVYSDRRLDPELMKDPVLHGECLAGALYWNDFVNLAKAAGFADPRLVEDRPLGIQNDEIAAKLGHAKFFSATYRLFKLDGLEPACEDYGQAVIYNGSIAEQPNAFMLDKHHAIETGRVFPVCGNTWRMLKETRFAEHFAFLGDGEKHLGIFSDCGTGLPFDDNGNSNDECGAGGCC